LTAPDPSHTEYRQGNLGFGGFMISSRAIVGIAAACAAFVAGLLSDARPAGAQGGIVCSYGPANYRRCCRESFAKAPRLGARARANDIDACMNAGRRKSNEPKAKELPKELPKEQPRQLQPKQPQPKDFQPLEQPKEDTPQIKT
jgi:hypothetical protein